jgi:hypothetical protein
VVRNAVVASHPGFSSVTAEGLYYYSAAEVVARRRGITIEAARLLLYQADEWKWKASPPSSMTPNQPPPVSRPWEDAPPRAELPGYSESPYSSADAVWRALHPLSDAEAMMDKSARLEYALRARPVPEGWTFRLRLMEPDTTQMPTTAPTAFAAFVLSSLGPVASTAMPEAKPGVGAAFRRRRALEIIGEHPWLYARIHLAGCLAFWLPGATEVLEVAGYTTGGKGTLAVLHTKGLSAAMEHYFGGDRSAMWLAGAMALVLLVKYFGVAACLVAKCRPRMSAAGWLLGLIVLVSFLLPGPAAHPRFRVPVEPILSIAAAVGWCALIGALRRRRASGRAANSSHEDQ